MIFSTRFNDRFKKVLIPIEKILFLGKLWQTQKIIRDNLIVKIHMFWEKVFLFFYLFK